MKTIFTLIAITAFLLTPLPSLCQENNVSNGGGGGFTIGYGYYDISKLQIFVPDEAGSLNNNQTLIGGLGYGFIGKLVLGGSGNGIVGNDIQTDSFKISSGGGMGTFNFGYLLVNKEKVKIFPMLGVGGGGYGVTIAKNKNISASSVAENPGQEINISKGYLALDASLNFNFVPMMIYDEKEKSYGGFMTGLQLGYAFSFPGSEWTYSGGNITGGPKMGMNMIYLKLIIGGFGYDAQ